MNCAEGWVDGSCTLLCQRRQGETLSQHWRVINERDRFSTRRNMMERLRGHKKYKLEELEELYIEVNKFEI